MSMPQVSYFRCLARGKSNDLLSMVEYLPTHYSTKMFEDYSIKKLQDDEQNEEQFICLDNTTKEIFNELKLKFPSIRFSPDVILPIEEEPEVKELPIICRSFTLGDYIEMTGSDRGYVQKMLEVKEILEKNKI